MENGSNNNSGTNSINLKFWAKDTGNLLSHGEGLTEAQVAALQSLKAGDRLILWKNSNKDRDTSSDFNLKVFKKNPEGVVSAFKSSEKSA